MPRRVKIESLTEDHGPQFLEESYAGEPLDKSSVFVDTRSGKAFDGQRGDKVSDLPSAGAIEVPRTTWY